MSIENIKKVKLGYYPTPIEKLGKITEILGKGDLYIKRDDMTGPAFGGNKTRKLEYLLQEALDTGCTAVLTVGGTQTNHGRTTMGAAIKLGLKPILVLEGKDNGYLSGNLTLDALMGTDIYFVENSEDMPAAIQKVCDKYAAQGDKVYCIPEGGSNTLGAIGYIMSINILVFVVLGGMGSTLGSIVAAVILTVLPETLRFLNDYRMLIYAVVLIGMMLINNNPTISSYVDAFKKKIRMKFRKKSKVEEV